MSLAWSSVKALSIPVGGTARDVKRVAVGGVTLWEKPSPLPYDAEVEWLESTGTQWIDTGVTVADPRGIAIEILCFRNPYCGFTHQNNVNGTWLGFSNDSAWWGKFSNRYQFSDSGVRQLLKWDGSNGFSRNSVLEKAFSASVGADSISGKTWPLFGVYNFNTNTHSIRAGVIYAARIWVSGVLVRDFIPVRVGSGSSAVGYLYDKANPTGGPLGNGLYGNSGSGAFVVGPDKNA